MWRPHESSPSAGRSQNDTFKGLGLKPIEMIGPGEPVWSFDFRSGQWMRCRVELNHSAVYEGQFVSLRFDDGTTLEVTEDHPFWVVAGDGLAQRPQLRERDATEDSGFSLPGLPYYAVGRQGILVHNSETGWFGRFKQWLGVGKQTAPTSPQPNAAAAALLRDPEFERLALTGAECTDTAGALESAAGGRTGGTISITDPGRVKHPTRGGVTDSTHHQVFTDGNFLFDPMASPNPIPRADYEALIGNLNGPDVNIEFIPAQQ